MSTTVREQKFKPRHYPESSRLYGISEAHLNKVVHQSGVAGDIETIRGRGNGVLLTRPPEIINEGDVCLIASACMPQTALKEVPVAFLTVLDSHTIADLASSPALVRLLEVA
jgi:Rrf2 family nitric oxide-sensitive transcriptional repressor